MARNRMLRMCRSDLEAMGIKGGHVCTHEHAAGCSLEHAEADAEALAVGK